MSKPTEASQRRGRFVATTLAILVLGVMIVGTLAYGSGDTVSLLGGANADQASTLPVPTQTAAGPVTTLRSLRSNPDDLVGQEIVVQGQVDEVPSQRGFWLSIPEAGSTVFVALSDMVGELPPETGKDSRVSIAGTFRKMSLEEVRRWNPAVGEQTVEALRREAVYLLADKVETATDEPSPTGEASP